MTASFPLSLAFLANRGTSERTISRITNGRTVRNRIFSKLNSFPVMDRIATCLYQLTIFRGGTLGQFHLDLDSLRRCSLVV